MNEILEIASDAAIRAGKLIFSMQGSADVSEKGLNNLVTQADISAEKMISEFLLRSLPGSSILGEEATPEQSSSAENLWIVDPLDGTNNFAHGIPHYATSVAFAQKGKVVCGAVYDPIRDELFSTSVDNGAFLNNKPIHVTRSSSIQECIISTGFHYDRGELMEKTLFAVRSLFRSNIRGIRRFGSAALDMCWVACGRFDGYFEYMLSPWDFAAAMLLVSQAGGSCFDRDGVALDLTSTGVICSNGLIDNAFLEHVRWSSQHPL